MYLAPDANAVRRGARVTQKLDKLGELFPDGMKASGVLRFDDVRQRYHPRGDQDPERGLPPRRLVVYLFLGNLRATLIPAVAAPVS